MNTLISKASVLEKYHRLMAIFGQETGHPAGVGSRTIPMFRISFFSNKVANRLVKKGVAHQDILSIKTTFKVLCDVLHANGYDADRAAGLWHRCIQNDVNAMEEMRRNTGVHGVILFGPDELTTLSTSHSGPRSDAPDQDDNVSCSQTLTAEGRDVAAALERAVFPAC